MASVFVSRFAQLVEIDSSHCHFVSRWRMVNYPTIGRRVESHFLFDTARHFALRTKAQHIFSSVIL